MLEGSIKVFRENIFSWSDRKQIPNLINEVIIEVQQREQELAQDANGAQARERITIDELTNET